MIDQAGFIRQFNDTHREQFNKELFRRSTDDIMAELKRAILCCQRSKVFTIRVEKFTEVDDYDEIHKILYDYYNQKKNRNKTKTDENRMDYIPIKDSDIKLLLVDYYIEVHNEETGDESTTLRVIIEVPRVVDKYYFYLFGNLYTITYQILESTYNNSASTSKVSCVTLKTMFMASRIYRFNINSTKTIKLKTTKGEVVTGTFYQSVMFGKSVQLMKYLLARYGLNSIMAQMKIQGLLVTDYDIENDDYYTFKRHQLYVSIPKFLFDKDQCVQSLVYCVATSIEKDTELSDIFSVPFWVLTLGMSYGTKTIEKGLSVLESFESIYDMASKEHLHLPPEDKDDIYQVMIWLMREYHELCIKDNLDITMKRVRYADYLALLYISKPIRGIIRISDKGSKISLKQIIKAIDTQPDFLIKSIVKDSLVNVVNTVNDNDSLLPLKYSYRGVSGLGEDGAAIPTQYRRVHKSHLGRIDMDAASATDPGLAGMLAPMSEIHNGEFSQEEEPNNWREEVDELLRDFKNLMGIESAFNIESSVGVDRQSELESIKETTQMVESIIPEIYSIEAEEQNAKETLRAFKILTEGEMVDVNN